MELYAAKIAYIKDIDENDLNRGMHALFGQM